MTCLDRELEGLYGPAVDLLRVALHVFTERFSLLSAGWSLAWQSRYEGADGLRGVGRDGGQQDGHHPQAESHAGSTNCQPNLIFPSIKKSRDKCQCWLLVVQLPISQNLVTSSPGRNIWSRARTLHTNKLRRQLLGPSYRNVLMISSSVSSLSYRHRTDKKLITAGYGLDTDGRSLWPTYHHQKLK